MAIFRKRDWRAGLRKHYISAHDKAADIVSDYKIARALKSFRASDEYRMVCPVRVLVVGVQSPKRGKSLTGIFSKMNSKKHKVEHISCSVGTKGRPENLNALLASYNIDEFDFVITTDDDIVIPRNFIDDFLAIAEVAKLDIAQPAHRLNSYYNHEITRREDISLVRITNFVEVGPLVMFRANTYPETLPFPITKYGWGIDFLWSNLADKNRWKLGIVDGTPIRHISPAGSTYDFFAAHAEMEQFRADNKLPLSVNGLTVLSYEIKID